MSKALFPSATPPKVVPDVGQAPKPGPNTHEVSVLQYDPDQKLVVASLPSGVQAIFELTQMASEGSSFTLQLSDNKLGPKIEVTVIPRVDMPKFNSPEEADAWLEANA